MDAGRGHRLAAAQRREAAAAEELAQTRRTLEEHRHGERPFVTERARTATLEQIERVTDRLERSRDRAGDASCERRLVGHGRRTGRRARGGAGPKPRGARPDRQRSLRSRRLPTRPRTPSPLSPARSACRARVIRGAITRGELAAVKRGGRWLIAAEAVRLDSTRRATHQRQSGLAGAARRSECSPTPWGGRADGGESPLVVAYGLRVSVHRKGTRWVVRYREAGSNRSRVFDRKRDADQFDAEVVRRRQLGALAALDAGRETLDEYVATSLGADVRGDARAKDAPALRQPLRPPHLARPRRRRASRAAGRADRALAGRPARGRSRPGRRPPGARPPGDHPPTCRRGRAHRRQSCPARQARASTAAPGGPAARARDGRADAGRVVAARRDAALRPRLRGPAAQRSAGARAGSDVRGADAAGRAVAVARRGGRHQDALAPDRPAARAAQRGLGDVARLRPNGSALLFPGHDGGRGRWRPINRGAVGPSSAPPRRPASTRRRPTRSGTRSPRSCSTRAAASSTSPASSVTTRG